MSKVYNYMFVAVGLTFLLKFAGIPSGADAFIEWIGLTTSASGVSLGAFFIGVIAVFTAGATASVIIGSFSRAAPESYLTATISSGIFTIIVSTFVSILNYVNGVYGQGWIYYIVWLMFTPIIVSFGVAIIEFWRGTG